MSTLSRALAIAVQDLTVEMESLIRMAGISDKCPDDAIQMLIKICTKNLSDKYVGKTHMTSVHSVAPDEDGEGLLPVEEKPKRKKDWEAPQNRARVRNCKYCGVGGFVWTRPEGESRWALVDTDGKRHDCRATKERIVPVVEREETFLSELKKA